MCSMLSTSSVMNFLFQVQILCKWQWEVKNKSHSEEKNLLSLLYLGNEGLFHSSLKLFSFPLLNILSIIFTNPIITFITFLNSLYFSVDVHVFTKNYENKAILEEENRKIKWNIENEYHNYIIFVLITKQYRGHLSLV